MNKRELKSGDTGMKLVDLVKDECIDAEVTATNKSECLKEITRLAKQSTLLRDVAETDILEGLKTREELGSTGFGNGIAIPHCRLPNVKDFVVGLIRVPEGVDFDSMDGKPVNLLVLIIAPESEANDHISLLSAVSRILRIPEARKEMAAASTAELLKESFLRYERDSAQKKGSNHLFHITTLNDTYFRDILQLLTGMSPSMLAVVEAKQASQFLAKIPLFAGFWSDREMNSGRLIIAQIDKRLTNETIRSIEDIVGKLDDAKDIAICVQDIFFSAGQLTD
jgi:PTS system nitrogen regulatory IIA component